jgi:hypothetical protein
MAAARAYAQHRPGRIAFAVRARIGNGALVHLAHVAGMTRFEPAAIWGLSPCSPWPTAHTPPAR